MSINTSITKWLEKAEPDYYTMFIKSWIPYNAWYMHNFFDEDSNPKRTSDRDIIYHIENNSNAYKNAIAGFLNGTSDGAGDFKRLISNLHYKLEETPIPDYDNRISFCNICIDNNAQKEGPYTITETDFVVTGKHDKNIVPKTNPRWIFEVLEKKTGMTISRVALQKCSISELRANSDFRSLIRKYQAAMESCLNEIDPNKKTNIVILPVYNKTRTKIQQPPNSIIIDEIRHLYFTDNIDDICRALIQILYELRCKLFHGEIEPSDNYLGIYEQAFLIQRILIKSLK